MVTIISYRIVSFAIALFICSRGAPQYTTSKNIQQQNKTNIENTI